MYTSLTYKIVQWNVFIYDDTNRVLIKHYEKTSVYFFPDNFKSYEELWIKEEEENTNNPDNFIWVQ